MTIQFASDLHLEFPQNKAFLKAHPLLPVGDVLVLAGDIVPFAVMDKHKDFFKYLSDHFKTTYWVPGNHEYYSFDVTKKSGKFCEDIKSNVHLVNNLSIQHDGIRFVFSTLWSKISSGNQWHIEKNMTDFNVIRYNGFRLSAERFNQLHEESLQFIRAELLQKNTMPTVVVTHHVPTFMHYPEKYKGDALNEAFAVELFDLIADAQPDYWLYGHHHHATPGFEIGKTRLLTNQLGYVQYDEHHAFEHTNSIVL